MSWFRLEAPILLAAVMVMTGSTPAVEIVAHRGASHDAPENTLAAVKLAWERDADGVEVDVYLTKDGRIAVLHDKTTKRTTGVDRPVAEMTLSELHELDAGSWQDPRWKGERIPSLEEVLDLVPPGKKMYVEVKCGPEIVPELVSSGGDPVAYRIRGALIALRREQAEWVEIEARPARRAG